MRNLWELTLKIFFYSPEMNRSILFSLYLLRMDEEDGLLSSKPRTQRENVSLVPYQSDSLRSSEWFLVNSQQVPFFVVLLLLFDRYATTFTLDCDACSSGRSAGTSVSLLFESIANLFDP